MCCTKMSSVINWIYSEQELFSNKRVENKLKRPLGDSVIFLTKWLGRMMLLPGSDLQKKKYFINSPFAIHKLICPITYKRNHWTESTKKIKKISKQKTLLTRIVNEHASLPGLENARRKKQKMISSKFRQKSFSSVSGMFRRPRTGNVRQISGKQLSEDIHRCLKLDPQFAALNQMATWGTF